MITIPVKTGRPYQVLVAEGLLAQAAVCLSDLPQPPGTCFLVADQTVYSLYGSRLAAALQERGFTVPEPFVPPAGESSKSLAVYQQLLAAMARARLTREDMVIALGGGVTGDLAGFGAATYLRGLPWVQIPTTLLAMIDASVGGKTALNLPEGKNLVGAFHQPSLVLCDPDLLATLPPEEVKNGMGELIKTGFLNRDLWADLEQWPKALPDAGLIGRAIQVKADLVAADERDRGPRRLLNLGHSFGHAIEALSRYQIPHGQAVALGLSMISRAAAKRGYCPHEAADRLKKLLAKHDLLRDCPYDAAALLPFLLADKKIRGDSLPLIIPRAIGQCEIIPVPCTELASWLKDGGAK